VAAAASSGDSLAPCGPGSLGLDPLGPAGYLAIESGWVVGCVGRQAWTVYWASLRTG